MVLSRKTTLILLSIILFLILGVGSLLSRAENLTLDGTNGGEKGSSFRSLLSYYQAKKSELPQELTKELREMREDILALWQGVLIKIGERIRERAERLWQRAWPFLKETGQNLWQGTSDLWELISNNIRQIKEALFLKEGS